MFIIRNEFPRPNQGVIEALGKIPTPNLSDAMGRSGAMHSDIKGVFPEARLAGPAYTVRNYAKDNLMSHYALKHASPGDILVVDNGGFKESAGWGELMSRSAKVRGLGGIVIDGGTRDVPELRELKFPVFARCVIPEGTVKVTPGSINCPVNCGGLTVCPGDVVVGDDDGVVVIPREQAELILEKARAIIEKEKSIRERILAGETIYDILNLDKFLDVDGVLKL
jgi:4-hydroxy-4-methyl-2-oxoglutarate aldolase